MIVRLALCAAGASMLLFLVQGRSQATPAMPVFGAAQSQFLLSCGGCHGTLGISPPQSVPVLRGRVGWFLCTPAGRDYIVRVPNVSRALLDDRDLAAVLNFVAFDLGERSAPAHAARFTAQEVGAIRRRALPGGSLIAYRTKVVKQLVAQCGAPRDMMDYGATAGRS